MSEWTAQAPDTTLPALPVSVTPGLRLPAIAEAAGGIYDVGGRRVKRLVDGITEAGARTVSWDGRDETGHRVAAGIYLARLQTPVEAASAKLIVTP